VRHAQGKAADPRASAWVSASAGVGKTKTLVDRLLRLLLDGAEPPHILCLTFTKAAAAEMMGRLHSIAEVWHRLSSDELQRTCTELLGRLPTPPELDRAGKLALILQEAPLKMQTIHSFCQNLLQQFAAEAGLKLPLVVLDTAEVQALQRQAMQQLYAEAAQRGDMQLAHALDYLASTVNAVLIEGLVKSSLNTFDLKTLCQLFDVEDLGMADLCPQQRALVDDTLIASFCEEDSSALFVDLIERLSCSTKAADVNFAAGLRQWWLALPEQRAALIPAYRALYFTAAGQVRQAVRTRYRSLTPDEIAAIEAEIDRLTQYQQKRQAIQTIRVTHAVAQLSSKFHAIYRYIKAGRLDYADLIVQAQRLLSSAEGPAVLYKLDGGLHHVLVDEAQDTSPEQWALIQLLVDDFFAGHGQHTIDGPPRTIFVVGDYKQSIYSFQGADPDLFVHMQGGFARKVQEAQRQWHEIAMDISFRSAPEIISFINQVFTLVPLGRSSVYQKHETACTFQGQVEVWPVVKAPEFPEPPAWAPPTVVTAVPSAATLLAQQIRDWIVEQINAPMWLNSRQRKLQPQDIMVLVRRRHKFVEALTAGLRQAGIPVSGVDDLVLTDNIYVQDLMALGDFILVPDDDLNLATLLKSPLGQIDEDVLFALCYQRGKQSLWQRVTDSGLPLVQAVTTRLKAWRRQATRMTPFSFFSAVIEETLWPIAAAEPLQAFLDWLSWYERRGLPTLPHVLAALRAQRPVVPTAATDEHAVRILTVHGAKGLQAPVVILPDTTQAPRFQERILYAEGQPVIAIGGWDHHPVTQQLKNVYQVQQLHEYYRLLYVALTRAEEKLIIAGWESRLSSPSAWYEIIKTIHAPS
jgi:ATP-dependent helicase/nuclease subunit A